MKAALRRTLFGDDARSLVYAVIGVVLFGVVLNGFLQAWAIAVTPPPDPEDPPVIARRGELPQAQPKRHVPPAELVFPLY